MAQPSVCDRCSGPIVGRRDVLELAQLDATGKALEWRRWWLCRTCTEKIRAFLLGIEPLGKAGDRGDSPPQPGRPHFHGRNTMSPHIRNSNDWKNFRDEIDLVQLACQLLGEPEKKDEDRFHWFCPFHEGTAPSFQVTQGKSFWRCFGCFLHGDAIDLVRQVKQFSFSQAVEFLFRPERGIRPESTVLDEPTGEIAPSEVIAADNDWIDDLLRGATSSD